MFLYTKEVMYACHNQKSLCHVSSSTSLIRLSPFKPEPRKHPPLSRQQILRLAAHTLEINPVAILPAPDTATVELKILHLLHVSSQISLEGRARCPTRDSTTGSLPGTNNNIDTPM